MPTLPDDDFLTTIHELAHLLRTRFDQRARAHDMTRAQWAILVKLDRRAGLTQNELAHLVEVEPITVARLVDRLEARGLVERRHDPSDRRVWRLHLTPASGPILKEIAIARREVVQLLLCEDITPETLAIADATLRQMKSNLLTAEGRSCADAAKAS